MSDLMVAQAQVALVTFSIYKRFEESSAIGFPSIVEASYNRAIKDDASAEEIVACYEEARKAVEEAFAKHPVYNRNLAIIFDVFDEYEYDKAFAEVHKRESEMAKKRAYEMQEDFKELKDAFDRFTLELIHDANVYLEEAESHEL